MTTVEALVVNNHLREIGPIRYGPEPSPHDSLSFSYVVFEGHHKRGFLVARKNILIKSIVISLTPAQTPQPATTPINSEKT